MIKKENEIHADVLKLCSWVEKSYRLPDHLFENEFSRMLHNFEGDMLQATSSEEYTGLLVGFERTLVGMAERHDLNTDAIAREIAEERGLLQ